MSFIKNILAGFILVNVCIGHFSHAQAQGGDSDSLHRVIANGKGEAKVGALLELAEAIINDSIHQSLVYAKAARQEALKSNNSPNLIKACYLTGSIFKDLNELDSSIYYFNLTRSIGHESSNMEYLGKTYHQLGTIHELKSEYLRCIDFLGKGLEYARNGADTTITVDILIDMGYIYDFWGDRDSALSCMKEALTTSEKIKYQKGIARTSLAMGNIYFGIENMEKALEYYQKTLEISREINNQTGIGVSLTNIGAVYSNLKLNKPAIESIHEAIEVLKEVRHFELLANAYTNLANIYADSGLYRQAEIYLDQGLQIFKENGSQEDIAISMFTHSNVFSKAGNYETSNRYLDTCLQIAEDIGFVLMQQECYQAYAKNYTRQNQYKKALDFQLKYDHLKDSLYSEKLQNQLIEFETQYKTEQNEREIEILQRDKELNALNLKKRRWERNTFIIGFILVLIIVIILLRNFRIKTQSHLLLEQKNQQLESLTREQQELIAMKNKLFSVIGHDLKNPFNSILGFSSILHEQHYELSDEEKKTMAENIHHASKETFRLLENLLDWSRSITNTIKFNPEILDAEQIIHEAFDQVKAQAENKNIHLASDIKNGLTVTADHNMLLTILRNLLSNAIKFSFPGHDIIIRVTPKDEKIIFSVIDYGMGMTTEQVENLFKIGKIKKSQGAQNEKGTGLGLLICKEFVEKHKGKIVVESSPGKGSSFHIIFNKNA